MYSGEKLLSKTDEIDAIRVEILHWSSAGQTVFHRHLDDEGQPYSDYERMIVLNEV